jgi:phosphate transport system permease protein
MRLTDQIAKVIFFLCALLLVGVIVSVIYFIASKAFLIFGSGVNPLTFLFGTTWDPTGIGHMDADGNPVPYFGAGGLILGSVVTTLLSVLLVIPFAVGTAIFFTELAPKWVITLLQPLLEIFTGIPSVVIGFLGLIVLVPWLQQLSSPLTGGLATGGYGWGAAILVLFVMVLPTVISVSIDALRAVPQSVREASLALGSTRWQMIFKAVVPAASTGIATAVVLGLARAIGETLAVAMVLQGHRLPENLFSLKIFFQPNVNITAFIAQDFGETAGTAQNAYWTLAFILLFISFLFICISRYLASRSVYK